MHILKKTNNPNTERNLMLVLFNSMCGPGSAIPPPLPIIPEVQV